MNEPTEPDGSSRTAAAASGAGAADPERECPACGDSFEDGVAYRDHLFSVGLVY